MRDSFAGAKGVTHLHVIAILLRVMVHSNHMQMPNASCLSKDMSPFIYSHDMTQQSHESCHIPITCKCQMRHDIRTRADSLLCDVTSLLYNMTHLHVHPHPHTNPHNHTHKKCETACTTTPYKKKLYVQTYVRTYEQMYAHKRMHICIYMHIHIHTYVHTSVRLPARVRHALRSTRTNIHVRNR